MALNVKNSFDSSGGLSTTLPREGLDIGPRPDFWGDLDRLQSRLRPRQQQMMQPQGLSQGSDRGPLAGGGDGDFTLEPTFATMQGGGFNMPGTSLNPWEPGMPYSMGNAPVQTGTRRVPRAGSGGGGGGFGGGSPRG